MTKHSQGVFEPTEGFFSQITFPIHLMVGSPKKHSDDARSEERRVGKECSS